MKRPCNLKTAPHTDRTRTSKGHAKTAHYPSGKSPLLWLFLLTALLFTSISETEAQRSVYDINGGLIIGFGLGASYQQSDIANSMGAGFDFTLGHHLGRREGAFFGYDWKFRFLAGRNQAYDHRINSDGTFSNIQYDFFNYDLEMGVTLNRLRELTRIVITGFAGAGITHGRTASDLLDDNGNPYDFSGIDASLSRNQIYDDLIDLTNGVFETDLINRPAILPTAGLFVGYQFTPSFTLGIEHKTNISLTERNSLVGINMDNRMVSGSPPDMNHYTSLIFRWSLGSGSAAAGRRAGVTTVRPSPDRERVVAEPPPVRTGQVRTTPPPSVTITSPASASSSVTEPAVEVVANVENVTSRQNIEVTVNGNRSTFSYNASTGIISLSPRLREGANTIIVAATNQGGTARDTRTVRFTPVREELLPVIRIINPPQPVTVSENILPLRAETVNIAEWHDLTFTINGEPFHNFSLSDRGIIITNVGLKEGENRIEIGGRNRHGTTTASTTVTYSPIPKEAEECPPPMVSFIFPQHEADSTDSRLTTIRAVVAGVNSANQIMVTLNGRRVPNVTLTEGEFSFPARLNAGKNSIVARVTNRCGTTEKSRTITYYRPLPEIPVTDTIVTDTIVADPVVPDTIVADTIVADTIVADTIVADTIVTDTIVADPVVPDTIVTDTIVADTVVADPVVPDTIVADTIVADTIVADTIMADTVVTDPVIPERPCPPPAVSFRVTPFEAKDTTHILTGRVTNTPARDSVTVMINNRADTLFSFRPETGEILTALNLSSGRNIVSVRSRTNCGESTMSDTIVIAPPADGCGVRFNPGNAEWQFCLVTPEGTYNRDSLRVEGFSYTGPAESLFFMAIAGGGDALVDGKPYTIRGGRYYLFTGNITVTVTNRAPGSMGQWTLCIVSDTPPESGSGNNRPQSPCEDAQGPPRSRRR